VNYIIITTAFNEENHIKRTLHSVIKQTILPKEWIIINDGSNDGTENIISDYSQTNKWIKLYSFPKESVPFGEHVHANFYKGYKKITISNWDVIVKLDADLEIDRSDFFEFQFNKMTKMPELGICSGITYTTYTGEKVLTKNRPYWRTGGAMKVYRRTCFEQIGGIKPIYGWDGLDEYLAMYNGWKTRTFYELHVNHLGKQRSVSRARSKTLMMNGGKSYYQRGYPFEFIFFKSCIYFLKRPPNAFYFLKGFLNACFTKEKRYVTKKEKRYIRKVQYNRLLDMLFSIQKL